eukprot:70937_1
MLFYKGHAVARGIGFISKTTRTKQYQPISPLESNKKCVGVQIWIKPANIATIRPVSFGWLRFDTRNKVDIHEYVVDHDIDTDYTNKVPRIMLHRLKPIISYAL